MLKIRILIMMILCLFSNNSVKSCDKIEESKEIKKESKLEVTTLSKVKLVCGTIEQIELTQKVKKPSYTMYANFGEFGKRISVGQFVSNYDMEALINRKVWAVLNFPPRRIAGIKSEYLTVGFYDSSENAVLLNNRGVKDKDIENGTQIVGTSQNEDLISFEDFTGANITAGMLLDIGENLLVVDIGKSIIKVPFKEQLDKRLLPESLIKKSVVVSVDPLDQSHELLYFRTLYGAVPISFDKEEDILLGKKLG